MLFLFLSYILSDVEYDKYAVMFSDKSLTKLLLAPNNLETYELPASTETIVGGSEIESPFYSCRTKLKQISFPTGSKLKNLGSYCFYKCAFDSVIDMSKCTELLIISECAFFGCSHIKEIILPPNIQELKAGCFSRCNKISSVSLPSSLLTIHDYTVTYSGVFLLCENLVEVIWEGVPKIKKIGVNAFTNTSIKHLRIPASIKNFDSTALASSKIESIEVDTESTTYSSDGITLYNKGMTEIVFCTYHDEDLYQIKDGVVTLQAQSFRGTFYKEVVIASSVKTIGANCFLYSALETITIPSTVTKMERRVFARCSNLVNLDFQPSITYIELEMFSECTGLKKFKVNRGIKELRVGVFSKCSNLNEIWIPNTVTKIYSACFSGISPNANITFEKDSEMIYEDSIIYSSDRKKIIACVDTSRTSITIDSVVATIGSSSFLNVGLKTITFLDDSQLSVIESQAFVGTSLERIVFPSLLKTIGEEAFMNVNTLTNVDFSKCTQLNKTENLAFRGTSIISVTFPSSLTSIGDEAFLSASKLSSVTFGNGLKSIGIRCFKGTKVLTAVIPRSVKTIGEGSFSGSSLQKLIFDGADEGSYISDYSFMDCKSLSEVQMCDGQQTIGRSAFQGCTALKSFMLSSSIVTISLNAFKGCTSLESVSIPDNSRLEEIEQLAFDGCIKLRSFNLTETNKNFVTFDGALYDYDITKIIIYLPASPGASFVLPDTVQEIKAFAFQNAINLQNVTIPEGPIERIGAMAFSGCTKLSYIRLPTTLAQIDSGAFSGCTSLGCGGIDFVFSQDLHDALISAGAPEGSLIPCPTGVFSVLADTKTTKLYAFAFPILDDECFE